MKFQLDMSDTEEIRKLYDEMYHAMIFKDTTTLGKILDDSFVLIHMTGMRQPKLEYLKYIDDGTLNYYACDETKLDVNVNGDTARLIGKSKVVAAVFGGGKHCWPLQLEITLKKEKGNWLMTQAIASTY